MSEKLLEAAKDVLVAEQRLAEAKARFQALAGNGVRKPGRPPKVVLPPSATATRAARSAKPDAPAPDELPVAQIVAKLFEGDKKYAFADILAAAGGREKRFAVKSALNKLRAKGEVKLANGLYSRKA